MIEIANLSVTLADKPILENYSLSVERAPCWPSSAPTASARPRFSTASSACGRPSAGTRDSHGRIGFVPQLFHSTFAFSVLDIVLMGRARHIGLFGCAAPPGL